ncbi:MAG: choice-of-anchor L domain-containing protein [Saprospiraceae bacterium]|nr:choice-of-anchor L domain-containing protein [Saprospiraceae bacterium]
MQFSTPRILFTACALMLATGWLSGQATTPGATPIVLDGHYQRHEISPQSTTQEIEFFSLIVGETYALTIPDDGTSCWPALAALNVEGRYDASTHVLQFTATATNHNFRIDYPCSWDASSQLVHHISLACQSCLKKDLKEYMKSMATLEVSPGGSADNLVRNVLIGGDCFDITGVTYSGNGSQIGTFSNGLTNIGFDQGMVIATGDCSVAIGPNDQDGASGGFGTSTPDADLAQLSGSGANFDLANIEFDFTPTQTPLTFEYVFASEEYCEYVGSQFNDAFGFFVSGPGISGPFGGAANIATVAPGTYVTINNVNHLSFSGLYTNNTPATGVLCGQTPSNAPSVNEVQFDGYTKKLTAIANVIPCQTYHIKIKICDIGDGIYDSAVFLKSGSFDGGGNASVEWVVNGDPDAEEVYEGCGTVQLVFKRVGGNINSPLVISYQVLGTATSPADYTGVPFSVVIPPGQTQVTIPVNIINDMITEGQESVIIKLNQPCSCQNPEEILLINDLPPLEAIADTVTICGAGAAELTVTTLDGVEPYTYQWNYNGNTTTSIFPFVNISTNYKVTVTDACGRTVVRTARIIVTSPPNAQLLPPAPQICPGGSGQITVNFNGVGPFTLNYTINNNPQDPIEQITDDPFTFSVNQPGLYQIQSVIDSNGCEGNGAGALLVTQSTLNMTGVVTNASCSTGNNGSINTTATGGSTPYNYAWSAPGIGNNPDPTGLAPGTYTVTVTDAVGCTYTNTYAITAPSTILPSVVNVQGTNCSSPNGGSIDLSVTGGTPNYTYLWSPGGYVVQDPTGLAQGNYTVTITDINGCTKTTTATVPGDFAAPTAVANAPNTITCQNQTVLINGNGSSTGGGISYNWTTTNGVIVSGGQTLSPTVSAAGTYTIVVTNAANGCTAAAQTTVNANNTPPTANAGPVQTLTCTALSATLDGSASSQGASFTYLWSATNGGNITGGNTSLNPIVNATGTYILTVTNTSNGCTSTSSVNVNNNTTPPNAVIGAPPLLTCTSTSVPLNGSGSTPAGNLSYSWTTTDGNIASGQTSSTANVTEPGQYTLIVTNNANGCTDDAVVTVSQDNSVPTANASVSGGLDCNTTQLTISGAGSSTGANFSFQWTASNGGVFVSGQNTLNPIVSAAGTYTLLVTNTLNNCTASATTVVDEDTTPPGANAGAPATLNCSVTTLVLGDPNAPVGPNLSYNWTASNGGSIVSGGSTPTPTIDNPGTYNLVVSNAQNGCSSTASVVINEDVIAPTAIVAPGGQLNCTVPVLQLNGAGSSTGPTFTYEWSSSSGGGIGAGGTTLTPTVTAAGTYTLTVTNSANGCTSTASATVTTNANLPTALATPSGILTCAVDEITVDAAGSSSGPGFTYNWGTLNGQIISGQGTTQIVAGEPGQYTLLVTNTANNCTASFTVDVLADEVNPIASAGPSQTLDCTQPSQVLDGSGSSSGPEFTYEWTTISGGNFVSPTNIVNPSVNEAGTYQLLVTNTTNGCTAVATVAINGDSNDPVVAIAAPETIDCDDPQITLNGSGSSTGANFSYNWNGAGIVSGNGTLNPVVDQPGNYTLVITNTTNGCTSSETVAVGQDIVPPVADAGAPATLTCTFPQLQIGGTGSSSGPNFTYIWTGPGVLSGGSTIAPIVNQGGQYLLTVTNTANGCTSTDQVDLATDFAQPLANAGPAFVLNCQQNSYTLQATASTGANFTYAWDTNTGSFTTGQNILNPTVNGAGTYILTVTNTTNGCTSTASVAITQDPNVPIAVAGTANQLTCAVTTVTLNGSASSSGTQYAYQWGTNTGNIVSGNSSLNPVVNAPGVYTLSVTDTNLNCTAVSQVTVDQDINAPVIDAGLPVTLTCTSPSLSLSGSVSSTGSFSYLWQATGGGAIVSGNTTLNPVVNAGGTYSLTVTNTSNGCTSVDNVLANVDQTPPSPDVQVPGLLTCAIDEITLDATLSTSGNMDYEWSTADGNIVDQTDILQPVVNEPGTYQLLLTNLDNGCSATALAVVGQDIQDPVAEAGSVGLLTCAVTSLQLDGTGSSQTGSFFYQWATPNGQILVGANTLTPTVVAGGTYLLTVINQNNGCSSTDQTTVNTDTQAPAAAIASPGLITCTQPQVTLNGTGSQPGPNIVFAWTTTDGNIVSGGSTNQAVVDASGTYILNVLNNTNGCTNTATAIVSDNIVLPDADAGPPATLNCTVEEVSLQGSGSTGSIYTYAWAPSQGGQIVSGANTLSPVVNQGGLYTLTVTNTSTGCTETDAVQILVETNVPTGFDVDLDKPSCKDNDGVITFTQVDGGVGPYLYSIDGGDSFLPEIDFQGITPGTYTLMIQDVNGCEYTQTLPVPQAPDPAVFLTPEFSLDLGDSTDLVASLAPGYSPAWIDTVIWTPTTGLTFEGNSIFQLLRPNAKPFEPTEYTVTIISVDGCEASDRVLVRVDTDPHIYIPNAFSPWDANGDNDVVFISADQLQVTNIHLFRIYDRWGEMVFEDRDFPPNAEKHGWNGYSRGKLMSPAVFVYVAEIDLIDGRRILFKGDVTLVR